MESVKLSFEQLQYYIILINVILGFLFGMFPLLSGIKMNNRKFGIYGFIGALIGGAILGVFLSFPIALVLTWLILKKPSATETEDVSAVDENAVEVKSDGTENP